MPIVACPQCGVKNRVDQTRIGAAPVCGRCGAKLPVDSGRPIELTDATFDLAVQDAGDKPILVDCWAPWCGPCRALAPIIDQIAADAAGRYIIAKLNTEIHQGIAARYRIDAIPCLLVFRSGKLVERLLGVQPRQVIEQHLLRALH